MAAVLLPTVVCHEKNALVETLGRWRSAYFCAWKGDQKPIRLKLVASLVRGGHFHRQLIVSANVHWGELYSHLIKENTSGHG